MGRLIASTMLDNSRAAHAVSAGDAASGDDDETGWKPVLEDVIERVGADAAVLTLMSADGEDCEMLVTAGNRSLARDAACRPCAGASPAPHRASTLIWQEMGPDRTGSLLHMPLSQGSGGLVLTAVFRVGRVLMPAPVRRVAEQLQPMLLNYVRLWQRFGTERKRLHGLESALNATDIGVLLLDAGANIIFVNRSAQHLLKRADGIRRKSRSVAATSLSDAIRLQVVIEHVISRQPPADRLATRTPVLKLDRRNGARPLITTILPTDAAPLSNDDPAAIVYILDPDVDLHKLIDPICRLYQLSIAESALVSAIVGGDSIADAAIRLRIKPGTARSYLKQIFVKTATHRQADLVRVMLSSLTRIKAGPAAV